MFKSGDYTVFDNMPYKALEDLLDWKINYEKEKNEQLNEAQHGTQSAYTNMGRRKPVQRR